MTTTLTAPAPSRTWLDLLAADLGDVVAVTATTLIVTDLADALGAVAELGGRLLAGPDDTPYGVRALVTDPAGRLAELVAP